MQKNGARTLLMGGQACVFYGAAEFSRDVDLLVPLADGLAPLWQRRTELPIEGETLSLLALPDLVLTKETQRDKDWPNR